MLLRLIGVERSLLGQVLVQPAVVVARHLVLVDVHGALSAAQLIPALGSGARPRVRVQPGEFFAKLQHPFAVA